MSIGMFSRASLVSIKALRAYHEQGLIVPAEVDPHSGYRSYRVSQLNDAVMVKRLRDLDLPLRDVGEILRSRDPDVTAKVLSEHERAMRARLDDVARIVDRLAESGDLPSLATPVHIRHEPAQHALVVRGRVSEAAYADFLGRAYGLLWETANRLAAVAANSGSARYPASVETDDEEIEAYLPIAEPVVIDDEARAGRTIGSDGDLHVVLDLIPAAHCAVATHVGSYQTIGDTYRQLGAWVARNARSAELPVREHYVVSVDPATGDLLPDDQLRTEISWPVIDDHMSSSVDHTPTQEDPS